MSWIGKEDGLRFAPPGTAVSARPIDAANAPESPCSLEFLLQPGRLDDSRTLVAFQSSDRQGSFVVRQIERGLMIRRTAGSLRADLFVPNIFRSAQPVVVAVSSGAGGTAVYRDGAQTLVSTKYRVTSRDCSGVLVLGTALTENDSWPGVFRGLGVYHHELTPGQAFGHHESWRTKGRPALTSADHCAALYLFNERRGPVIHDQTGSGPDLLIPGKYQLQDQTLLWSASRRLNLPDALLNIAGFLPLGLSICAWLTLMPSIRRPALIAVILGGALSLAIEIAQAHLPTRHSDLRDVLANTAGTWVGAVIYRYIAAYSRRRQTPDPSADKLSA